MSSRRHTPLNKRKRHGKALRSPFHALGEKISWSSWKDDHLPNILWAALAAAALPRDEYLSLFREIAARAREKWLDDKDLALTHSALSVASYDDFEYVFRPLKCTPNSTCILSSVKLVDCLPDAGHWKQFYEGDASETWALIADGIAGCLDHQSERSTDIRWLKLVYLAICGRLVLPNEKMVDQLRLYPNEGDMRMVRPMIRAAEMSVRMMETGPEKPEKVPNFPIECFWSELFEKTNCIPADHKFDNQQETSDLEAELRHIINELGRHFLSSIKTTGVDSRLDGAFGLVFYSMHLAFELSLFPSNQLSSGRIILRAIVEATITLRYLTKKDEPSIWNQYRNYGSGQSALAYLKTVDLSDAPAYIHSDDLEMLASEDAWFETKDILIGNWASRNLREIATDAGCKDLYDRYYDFLSSFSHSQWGAVRDTCFTLCLNPLHRLHRIPVMGRPKPSVLADVCKLLNLMLDDLNMAYPSFKPRLKWHKLKESDQKEAKPA